MLALHSQYFTGEPDAATSCPSGSEGAGRRRISAMVQRTALPPYLSPFDHFVLRELRCPGYARYVDDVLLFGNDAPCLWEQRKAVVERLARLRLTIHPNAQPRPTSEGFPFLGFVVYPTHRRLKRRKVVAYRRKLKRSVTDWIAGETTREVVEASLLGWINHARYGDTWGLRASLVREIPAFRGGVPCQRQNP